eukprot:Cvel_25068.t1-p1 / transcript=Cvel_25068.t1 / gene=Cvel_25068 / organism=Chromera_velia_CCMP2878 / gene_product=hypothetical protein / transcript_product=hypothetical protein / location=Cvel_scaffold2789:19736-23118(+) / protein_length=500 / sequence_SO=supercontig / SO=protein_coding / is_pseudo=false
MPSPGPSPDFEGPRLSFKDWVEKQDANILPLIAQKRYEQYLKEYADHHAAKFFSANLTSGYLVEKYHPPHVNTRLAERKEQTLHAALTFFRKLENESENFNGLCLMAPKPKDAVSAQSNGRGRPPTVDDSTRKEETVDIPVSSPSSPPYYVPDLSAHSLTFLHVPLSITRFDVITALQNAEGLQDVMLSEPRQASGGFFRRGLAIFATPQHAQKAEESFKDTEVKPQTDPGAPEYKMSLINPLSAQGAGMKNKKNKIRAKLAPIDMSTPERVALDVLRSADLIRKLDVVWDVTTLYGRVHPLLRKEGEGERDGKDVGADSAADGGVRARPENEHEDDTEAVEGDGEGRGRGRGSEATPLRSDALQLDLQLIYLREVHNVCYYSGEQYEHTKAMQDAAGDIFLRRYYVRTMGEVLPTCSHEEALASVASLLPPGGGTGTGPADASLPSASSSAPQAVMGASQSAACTGTLWVYQLERKLEHLYQNARDSVEQATVENPPES